MALPGCDRPHSSGCRRLCSDKKTITNVWIASTGMDGGLGLAVVRACVRGKALYRNKLLTAMDILHGTLNEPQRPPPPSFPLFFGSLRSRTVSFVGQLFDTFNCLPSPWTLHCCKTPLDVKGNSPLKAVGSDTRGEAQPPWTIPPTD